MGKKTTCRGDDLFLLPGDYLIQILVWLPVTSLLRFKSVCKSWHALIESSFFIDLHTVTTSNSSSSSKFGSFILQASQYHRKFSEILMLSSESRSRTESGSSEYGDWYWGTDGSWHKSTGGAGGDWHWDNTNDGWYWVNESDDDDHQVFKVDDDDDQLLLKLDYLELPPSPSLVKLSGSEVIVGSCNGLICLYDPYLRAVFLWNPATRQLRRLPKSITTMEMGGGEFVAFGFDVETKDYKVLLINYITQRCEQQLEYLCRVQVYSLSTDSWRLLEGINSLPGVPMPGHQGLYLNGSCLFMAIVSYPERELGCPCFNRFIISFDFTKEIFTTMEFPEHDTRHHLHLCCLGGGEKMALFTTLRKTSSSLGCEYDNDGCQDCDIWVLNEHGSDSGGCVNKESWNKLHSFQIKNIIVDDLTMLRGISNNGKFALLESMDSESYMRMQLYNLVTKEAKKDFLIRHRVPKLYVYKPSLVSIIGGNGTTASPAIG